MTPSDSSNRYRTVEALYQQALDVAPERRAAFLAAACDGDDALRHEVDALLAHYAAAGASFLGQPSAAVQQDPVRAALPMRVGRYTIARLVGEGGMGAVFEAVQESPHRTVALKLIREAFISPAALRRFELEAEFLGRLEHPGIAHVYEAGVAEVEYASGPATREPFIAMELVRGPTLAEYVATAQLGLVARLELFARICDAVQHAHQKGVIHCDLKPGNILVATSESDAGHTAPGHPTDAAVPKILDFGVARLSATASDAVTMTRSGAVLGTPAYMSPEQAAGRRQDIDARSDVYALGVIGYELLAGRLPYDLQNGSCDEVLAIIRQQEARPLGALQRALRGDLEVVFAKALAKDRDRRYATAAELAADVRRCVRHEPISARRPGLWYVLSKCARRRRGFVAAAAVVLLVIVAGASIAGSQALRAAEADRVTRAVNAFLNEELLAQANPYNEPDRDIRLRDVLDRASARIAGLFDDAPAVEAAIRETLGVTYRSLGEFAAAKAHLRRALDLTQATRGERDRQTIRLLLDLGQAYSESHDLDAAEPLWTRAAALATAEFGPQDADTLLARNNLAVLAKQRGAAAQAETIAREVLAARRRTLGDEHGATLVSMNTLASALQLQGRFAEAEPLYEEYLATSRRVLGPDHPDTLTAISNLGLFYARLDRFADAEPLCREVLETRRRVLGENHPATLVAMNNVGFLYSQQQRYDECQPFYDDVYVRRRQHLGPEHPDTLLSMNNLAWLHVQLKQWDTAEALLRELLDTTRRVAPDSQELALALQAVGVLHVKRGRPAEAEPLLREAVARFRATMPPGDWRIGACQTSYGNCLRHLGRYADAEVAMLEGYELQHAILGPVHQQTRRAVEALVELYTDWARPEQANVWRARLDAQGQDERTRRR